VTLRSGHILNRESDGVEELSDVREGALPDTSTRNRPPVRSRNLRTGFLGQAILRRRSAPAARFA
jgi:hypothetical protein